MRLRSGSQGSRAGGIAFGAGTQLFFAFTVYFLFEFLRVGSGRLHDNWLLVDILLALQFAVIHSFLLLPSTRTKIARLLAGPLYGCLFAAATCGCLWLMFVYWRRSPTLVWNATGRWNWFVQTGFYLSWVALFFSLKTSGLGYQTGLTPWLYWLRRQPPPRRGFVVRGGYRILRHPVYLSFLGLVWFTPQMTADHALLTCIWTAYIFLGSCLKDRRLEYYLGDTYRHYASQVAGYPGITFGPLGKWPQVASGGTLQEAA